MNRTGWDRRLQALWYGDSRIAIALLPVSWLYCGLVSVRRLAYRIGLLRRICLDCRVIVVGNIAVGGTGKTPLVIAIAKRAQQAGLRVGILARGYLGRAGRWPQQVSGSSDPGQVGDEAVLLARKTGAEVFAGPDRVASGRALLKASPCDLLICDDGLQHYALQTDTEIALVDAMRGQGNGLCLPAGPLREPVSRLRSVDAVVALGDDGDNADWPYSMRLVPGAARNVADPSNDRSLASFCGHSLHAVAGIGNPERFFTTLRAAGLRIQAHPFADHHPFSPADLEFGDSNPVLMTEKDALKCEQFAQHNWWFVPIEAQPDARLENWLAKLLNQEAKRG
ncbi:MAG: tetraacyldisaccharide 4'-kinase [Gammaproteobacteria bacterium]|nr:MAG: tetraacyldisaccharide 4'-kinase [Gammaproteobacteria bacterium]